MLWVIKFTFLGIKGLSHLKKNSIMSDVMSKKERGAKTHWSIGPSWSLGQRLKRGEEKKW